MVSIVPAYWDIYSHPPSLFSLVLLLAYLLYIKIFNFSVNQAVPSGSQSGGQSEFLIFTFFILYNKGQNKTNCQGVSSVVMNIFKV